MKIEQNLTIRNVGTFRSKGNRERIGILSGYLGENESESTILFFPDPDCKENPAWWLMDGEQTEDSTYGQHTQANLIGSLDYPSGSVIKVELDYEEGHSAKRLKILSAQGVAFLSEYEGVVPKWCQQ